jgi:hypothetical protein
MVSFIDDHRHLHGVEPMCKVLAIAPSTYYEHRARHSDPERLPERAKRDAHLRPEIQRVWDANFQVCTWAECSGTRGCGLPWRALPTNPHLSACTDHAEFHPLACGACRITLSCGTWGRIQRVIYNPTLHAIDYANRALALPSAPNGASPEEEPTFLTLAS